MVKDGVPLSYFVVTILGRTPAGPGVSVLLPPVWVLIFTIVL